MNEFLFIHEPVHSFMMVNSRVAIDCTNQEYNCSGISFHRFLLQNPKLLQKWIKATKEKTGIQPITAKFVVHIVNNHALLSR